MGFRGVFQLDSPDALLSKLRHDLARLQRTPDDPYIAFDFFVTAEHMLDWVYPGAAGKDQRTDERRKHVLLQVISHLATGAKHMVPEAPHHNSVSHADVAYTAYGESTYGSGSYGGVELVIELDGDAAATLGRSISPLDLAKRALDYWERHPTLAKDDKDAGTESHVDQ